MVTIHPSASQRNVVELLQKLHRHAIDAIHEIEEWPETDSNYRRTDLTTCLAHRLRDRYLVEHGTWWGLKDSIPPRTVDILRLRCPFELRAIRKKVVNGLRHQIIGPVLVLNGNTVPGTRPTQAETAIAQQQLITNLETIKSLVLELSKALDDFAVPKPDTKKKTKLKKPPQWAIDAFKLKLTKLTLKEIKKELRLDKDEGTISRAIKKTSEWFGANGNLLSDSKLGKTISMDPSTC